MTVAEPISQQQQFVHTTWSKKPVNIADAAVQQKSASSGIQCPWVKTPLTRSKALSKSAGCNVYMKLDLLQPGGSFKSRGLGNMCLRSIQNHPNPETVHFYSSSGGNAGLACATAARALGREATVVVPKATSELMKIKIQAAGAKVFTHGESWQEADDFLRRMIENKDNAVYCPPFDHEYVWEGNSTIVDELASQLPDNHPVPDAIVLSVGGGGLLNGVLMGLRAYGWDKVPVLAVETLGADSLGTSLKLGSHTTLPRITSKATSLGARRISEKTWQFCKNGGRDAGFDVRSAVLDDDEAMMGCWRLAEDERLMVEIACGVSVAPCYNGVLKKKIPELTEDSNVVVIICGGSNVSLEMLRDAQKIYVEREAAKSFETVDA